MGTIDYKSAVMLKTEKSPKQLNKLTAITNRDQDRDQAAQIRPNPRKIGADFGGKIGVPDRRRRNETKLKVIKRDRAIVEIDLCDPDHQEDDQDRRDKIYLKEKHPRNCRDMTYEM